MFSFHSLGYPKTREVPFTVARRGVRGIKGNSRPDQGSESPDPLDRFGGGRSRYGTLKFRGYIVLFGYNNPGEDS